MKKIYEHNGKKYELVKSDTICKGCAFHEYDGEESICHVNDDDDLSCTGDDYALDYIFKQITEPNETNQKEL
jgi:hypothetical protein